MTRAARSGMQGSGRQGYSGAENWFDYEIEQSRRAASTRSGDMMSESIGSFADASKARYEKEKQLNDLIARGLKNLSDLRRPLPGDQDVYDLSPQPKPKRAESSVKTRTYESSRNRTSQGRGSYTNDYGSVQGSDYGSVGPGSKSRTAMAPSPRSRGSQARGYSPEPSPRSRGSQARTGYSPASVQSAPQSAPRSGRQTQAQRSPGGPSGGPPRKPSNSFYNQGKNSTSQVRSRSLGVSQPQASSRTPPAGKSSTARGLSFGQTPPKQRRSPPRRSPPSPEYESPNNSGMVADSNHTFFHVDRSARRGSGMGAQTRTSSLPPRATKAEREATYRQPRTKKNLNYHEMEEFYDRQDRLQYKRLTRRPPPEPEHIPRIRTISRDPNEHGSVWQNLYSHGLQSLSKQMKLQEIAEQRRKEEQEAEEMAACTFRPKISPAASRMPAGTNVYKRLYEKDLKIRDETTAKLEKAVDRQHERVCTFQPRIKDTIQGRDEDQEEFIERLYSEADRKANRLVEKKKRAQEAELSRIEREHILADHHYAAKVQEEKDRHAEKQEALRMKMEEEERRKKEELEEKKRIIEEDRKKKEEEKRKEEEEERRRKEEEEEEEEEKRRKEEAEDSEDNSDTPPSPRSHTQSGGGTVGARSQSSGAGSASNPDRSKRVVSDMDLWSSSDDEE